MKSNPGEKATNKNVNMHKRQIKTFKNNKAELS